MATAPWHALPASATFPAPGVAASIQRAVAAARQTGDRPADPAPVDTLLEIHAGTTYRIALGIARDAGRAEAALHVVFPHFLGGPGRPAGGEALARWPRRAVTREALRRVARASSLPLWAVLRPHDPGSPGPRAGLDPLRPRVRPPSGPSQRSAVAAGELGRAGRAAVAEEAIDGLSGRERATLVPVDG